MTASGGERIGQGRIRLIDDKAVKKLLDNLVIDGPPVRNRRCRRRLKRRPCGRHGKDWSKTDIGIA